MLRGSADDGASPVAYLDQGVTGAVLSCNADADLCKVAAGNETGYLAREDFWGVFAGEAVLRRLDRLAQMLGLEAETERN